MVIEWAFRCFWAIINFHVATPLVDPSGQWLFAAHQDSHNVVLFKVDTATGDLTPAGKEQRVGGCVCVKFVTLE